MSRAALCAVLLIVSASGAATAADWQSELFGLRRVPKGIHYRARVADRSEKVHLVEAWREPERLRRSSDGVLDLYATRTGSSVRAVLVDKRSGRVIRGDEDALLRAGHAEAWNELAFVLVKPAGKFDLSRMGRPKKISGTSCQPYRVVRHDGTAFNFCWSPRLLLPLEIDTTVGRQAFVVDFVERKSAPDQYFLPPAAAVMDRTNED